MSMDERLVVTNTFLTTQFDSFMDLDYMDELLLEGCFLETIDDREFAHHRPSISNMPFDSSFVWPTLLDTNDVEFSGSPSKDGQQERQRLSFSKNLSVSQFQELNSVKVQSFGENSINAMCSSGQSDCLFDAPELSRRWWIGPNDSSSVMDRLIQALGYIKNCSKDKDILIQIWVPIYRDGKRVLSTNDQPFSLDLNCPRLAHYRQASLNYQFPANDDSKEMVGLPGRVFLDKVPEWTPDVQFFQMEEYPRVGHAQQYNVRGTLAVPVFEQGSRNCLSVIEVVRTTQKIKYSSELESVCKALEAVDLRSSEVSSTLTAKACDLTYQAALSEILEVLKSACKTHGLPLAQTWVPCIQHGKGGSRHSNENLIHCVSTEDSACYVADPRVQGFHEACSEHHLLKGQGVVGSAFMTNQPCFTADLTSYSKAEYPLSHYARMFGLHAAVAIRLRSMSTGSSDFVLEFFLPPNCRNPEEHKRMLTSLSIIIQNVCQTFRVVSDKELQDETVSLGEVTSVAASEYSEEVREQERKGSIVSSQERTSWTSSHEEVQETSSVVSAFQDELLTEEPVALRNQTNSGSATAFAFSRNYRTAGEGISHNWRKARDRRRLKAEKNITLQILQQYFAGSLKDAAKSIGVCPTTLKRICRQHGIQRWPSRKIKKVGLSLERIQRVINSVQGVSGTLQIESFYSDFPEFASSNISRSSPFADPTPTNHPEDLNRQPESGGNNAATSKSVSSSCSQGSSSSQRSIGTQPHPYPSNVAGHEDPVAEEASDNHALKRVNSDAELHLSSEALNPQPRSQSHASLTESPKSVSLSPMKKSLERSQEGAPRIKVIHGEEKIRFRIQKNWGYKELMREIARRFGVDDPSGFHLKYLDDDSDWVLLTCEADLEECIDVCWSSQNKMIRLLFLCDSQPHLGSSFGSSSSL
ncbi:protein NLP5 [Nicotiana tabacum]|uniref:Protein NLP5 n=1 Tax=Nicotiana tabacum TaxID=4097 RepID=A0A1S3XQJ0_TOBAC|nr:protein NLP5-like [Nicotiana tomentosiformis]XP_009600535.1 protein NLP5-like [Nicotiana tomentosiformis]XP_016442216.1 PREDICTED: protein NLP5-like [Nicotiana tabacum]XP_016442217.1 PREDICTED: protein NLP5-like [Nicotiana tabacum]XP_016442218.1 PREDICTED: protein NLP5-like [Nicotiana tabacum]